jgi:hypothetical protein
MKRNIIKPTPEQVEILRQTGSSDRAVAYKAMAELGKALQIPLRSAILEGDILAGIYTPEVLDPSATAEYPLDFLQKGNANDYIAYSMPSEGAIPMRSIVSDSITVGTYQIANAIDWPLKYSMTARWNIVARALQTLEYGFIKKNNTDGWRVLISAAAGRTDYQGGAPLVYDSAATPGQFTKRLVSLMKTSMARLAGGNTASLGRGRLTDLYISHEALEDIREWDKDEVDDFTRREIFTADDMGGPMAGIYGVRLHPLDELGEGREFQLYFATLGVNMGTNDKEIVIGLDLSHASDSFVMPIKQEIEVYDDSDKMHRRGRAGYYAFGELGYAVLDGRFCLLGSF